MKRYFIRSNIRDGMVYFGVANAESREDFYNTNVCGDSIIGKIHEQIVFDGTRHVFAAFVVFDRTHKTVRLNSLKDRCHIDEIRIKGGYNYDVLEEKSE